MIQVTHRFFASPHSQSSQPPTPSQPRTNREPPSQPRAASRPRRQQRTRAEPPRPGDRRPCTSPSGTPAASRQRTSEPRSTNGGPWNASVLRISSAARGSPHTRAPPTVAPSAAPQRRHAACSQRTARRPPPAARNFAICPSTTAAMWGPKPRSDPGIPRRAGRCSVILRCMAWASLASCHCTAMACEPRGEGLYARAFGRKPRLCYHMAHLVIYRQRTDRRVTSKRGRTTHTLKDSCLLLSASTSLGTITSF